MKDAKLFTVQTGKTFRAVLVGRSQKVFGTRLHVVRGQPRHGHASRTEASEFAQQRFGLLGERVDAYAAGVGDGQFVSAAKLKSLKPVDVGVAGVDSPVKVEWKSLPLANLYAAGIAAKAYIEKTMQIERLRAELDGDYQSLARAIGQESADKMIAGIRSDTP